MAQSEIRINKILNKFNIALPRLVEFLAKKGIAVDSNPNAKISMDAYNLVAAEFGDELTIKEESKKIFDKKNSANEVVSIKDIKDSKDESANEEKNEEEITIRVTTIEKPKILGKINIDDFKDKKTKQQNKEENEEKTPETIKEEAIEPNINTEPIEEKVEIEPQQEQPKEEKTETKAEEKPQPEPIKTAPESISSTTAQQQDENDDTEADESQKIETDAKSQSPTIVGTVDLSQFKKKKKHKKKHKSENENTQTVEAAQKITEEQTKDKKEEEPKKDNFIPTLVEKLSGPVIVQTEKVDLSQFDRKGDKGKRKRERKRVEGKVKVKVDVEKNIPTQTKDDRLHKKKKTQKKDFKQPVRREVDEDEVQRQVKETLARLTEGHGKTKSSKYRREKREAVSEKIQEQQEQQIVESKTLKVTEFVTVSELANMMNVPVTKVIEACMNLGLMVSINQRLDAEALVLVAEEFGFKTDFVSAGLQEEVAAQEDKPEDLVPRPPIVTVMGHVDHGKTSLLDNIRKTNVIAGEAGGITQHIGAYNVKLPNGRRITFLDTPGHEAFTAMRARGAKVTDIAIIIIAADDAIMPQTKEAINHAQAAGVPMIFAINKIDKPGANIEKIKEQLAAMNLLVEDWGGKYQCQEISAKKGINVDKLLEKILLEADMLDLKANPNKPATGSIIESSLDKGRGYVATVLVSSGTLHMGDAMLAGCNSGRVKAMYNERGQRITDAGPSSPAIVLGLNGAPAAGENFNVMEDEREARDIANKREQLIRIQGIHSAPHVTLDEIGRRIAIGNFKELNIIIKGDVDGSIEALSDSMLKLSTPEVQVNVIHKAVGAISESDVLLAAASNAVIIGFQVRPSASARKLAETEAIEIRLYSVIYDAINEVKDAIEGMLAPEIKEQITASVEVMETFKVSKVGTVAGGIVREGKISRTSKIRVIRDGIVVYTGQLGSLKRYKDDAKEVTTGLDCGLNVENFNDIKVGDFIEGYEQVEVKRKL